MKKELPESPLRPGDDKPPGGIPLWLKLLLILFLALLIISLVLLKSSSSRTWYIKADGSGDAPTIQAGVDSAVAGDSVVVARGIYEESLQMEEGLILMAEEGPYYTKIVPEPSTTPPYAINGLNLGPQRTEINGFWIEGFIWGTSGAISLTGSRLIDIVNNIFTGNKIGISLNSGSAFIRSNTFYGNLNYAIDVNATGSGVTEYNIIWNRAIGFGRIFVQYNDFFYLSDQGDGNFLNFSLDPEFCGAGAGNFFLQSDSPCAPGNSPWPTVGLIGALPVDCGPVNVEARSWGAIKAIYKE